jgi:hypothetical protein
MIIAAVCEATAATASSASLTLQAQSSRWHVQVVQSLVHLRTLASPRGVSWEHVSQTNFPVDFAQSLVHLRMLASPWGVSWEHVVVDAAGRFLGEVSGEVSGVVSGVVVVVDSFVVAFVIDLSDRFVSLGGDIVDVVADASIRLTVARLDTAGLAGLAFVLGLGVSSTDRLELELDIEIDAGRIAQSLGLGLRCKNERIEYDT